MIGKFGGTSFMVNSAYMSNYALNKLGNDSTYREPCDLLSSADHFDPTHIKCITCAATANCGIMRALMSNVSSSLKEIFGVSLAQGVTNEFSIIGISGNESRFVFLLFFTVFYQQILHFNEV